MTARLSRLLARDSIWVLLGLLITLAAAWRVVATPGEIIQGDLGYPFANEFWTRRFTSAWDTSYGSVLVNVMRTYTYVPWGYLAIVFDMTTEVGGKLHWLSWHLLGYLAGYAGTRLMVGPDFLTRKPIVVRLGLAFAGLFWALNPWTLARWEQLGVHVSAVLLPLVLGLVVAATRAKDFPARAPRALAAAATLAFAVSTSPLYMAAGFSVALGWFACAAVTTRDARRQIAITAMVFLGGFAIFAAFILVPLLVTAAAGSPTGPRYAVGTDVQPVLASGQSVINTLTLTGHTFFGPNLKPDAPALPGWRMAALVPAILLVLALWRHRSQRRMLGYSAVVGCATALIQIASWHDLLRPLYLAVAANAPFGWVLREPDKLSGGLALAYLPGLALAPATCARLAPRRLPALGVVQTSLLGILLAAFMVPGIHRMLWNDQALSLVPERFPASFWTVPAEIDRRNAAETSRTLLAAWPLRFPEWSRQHRVLHAIEILAVTTPYAVDNSLVGDRLVALLESGTASLADTLRAYGVARILVPTGTARGRNLASQLRHTKGLEPEFSADHYEVFRTREPPYPWVYELGPAGPVPLPWRREGMHRLIVEVPPTGVRARQIATQEFWDPLWTLAPSNYGATLQESERGLLEIRTDPGASGRLVLSYALHPALVAGHAVTWGGLAGWGTWMLWQRRRRGQRRQ